MVNTKMVLEVQLSKRKPTLIDLWIRYINQSPAPSEDDMKYVAALKARIDVLELDNALLKGEIKAANEHISFSGLDTLK